MLTIIHGSDIVASRKFFLDTKQSSPDALLVDAESVTLTDLTQIFEGGGLFGESKYIFIEQIITKRKKSGDYKDIITYLDEHATEHMIYLWENKELEIGTIKMFRHASERPFKLPQTLFTLLDSLRPGNGPALLKLFHQSIETAEPEMVFFMLVRQLRILIALHSDQSSLRGGTTKQSPAGDRRANARDDGNPIDEVKRLTWQKAKMQKQAASFKQEDLLMLYQKLFEIEKGQKTGTLSAPITTIIDFFLLEI